MAATKINITKINPHSNVNMVRGYSYRNFYTPRFIIRKFVSTKISRSTVFTCLHVSVHVTFFVVNVSFLLCAVVWHRLNQGRVNYRKKIRN